MTSWNVCGACLCTQGVLLTWHFLRVNATWLMDWPPELDGAERASTAKREKYTSACPRRWFSNNILVPTTANAASRAFSWPTTISGLDLITQGGKWVWFIAKRLVCALITPWALAVLTASDRWQSSVFRWINWDRPGATPWCNDLIPLLSVLCLAWRCFSTPNRKWAGGACMITELSHLGWWADKPF